MQRVEIKRKIKREGWEGKGGEEGEKKKKNRFE